MLLNSLLNSINTSTLFSPCQYDTRAQASKIFSRLLFIITTSQQHRDRHGLFPTIPRMSQTLAQKTIALYSLFQTNCIQILEMIVTVHFSPRPLLRYALKQLTLQRTIVPFTNLKNVTVSMFQRLLNRYLREKFRLVHFMKVLKQMKVKMSNVIARI